MCEKCLETALQIDPQVIAAMNDVKPEFEALRNKLQKSFTKLLPTSTVDAEGNEVEPTEEMKKELEAYMSQVTGYIGFIYTLGWYMGVECKSTIDLIQKIQLIMPMITDASVNGKAYGYLIKMEKH